MWFASVRGAPVRAGPLAAERESLLVIVRARGCYPHALRPALAVPAPTGRGCDGAARDVSVVVASGLNRGFQDYNLRVPTSITRIYSYSII